MKIVCDSCGAKYSIADEKVAGKVFKIRCKRCSEVIMVRGDQSVAPASTESPEPAGDAIWHVVVNGEQHGPYAPVQLGEMLTAGTVDWEAYVWTEGFENWSPMRDVEDLVAKITGQETQQEAQSAQQTAAGGFAAAGAVALGAGAEAFANEPSMGADPFAEDPAGVAAASSAAPDLFTDVTVSAAPDAGVVASGPAAMQAEAGGQPLTGARNENSVLFSLQNLQALATGSTSAAPPASDPAGYAAGEGSGLIDIRALAAATGVENQAAASPAADQSDKDELLAMGGQGAAFGSLGSPILAPAAEEPEGGNRTMMIAAIVGGCVVLAGGMVAFAMLSKNDAPVPAPGVAAVEPAAAAAAADKTGLAAANGDSAAKTAQPPTPPEVPSEGAAAAAAANADDGDTQADAQEAKPDRSAPNKRAKRSPNKRVAAPSATKAPAKSPTPSKPAATKPKSTGRQSIDDLLDGALSGKPKPKPKAAPKKAPASNLPEKPSRSDVLKAMNGVKKAVSACAKGKGGVATASITVAGPTGRVKSAQIQGQTGAVGSCIARAVRKARFPKFQSQSFQIKYPFRL